MRNRLRFLHAGKIHELRDVDPTLTVLRYLREQLGLCGTKEGCAEGDCGACTVVIGELDGDQISYRATNACIQMLATLDGKQLITVEELRASDGSLHPVQQAMVDCHGSQCGFCTPGFVMTLFTLYHRPAATDRLGIQDALAGNLCRCTGYGPIVTAAESACNVPAADDFAANQASCAEQLRSIAVTDSLSLESQQGRFLAPIDAAQAVSWLDEFPDACLLAGGTDVGLWVTKQHRRLDPLIYLGQVRELQGISCEHEMLRIGAGVTVTQALPEIARHFPDFGEMLRRYGAEQVRNVATLGGNIANGSPIGDSPPPLIALGATLVLHGPNGQRRMPLEEFFLDYGRQDRQHNELVEAIEIPLLDSEDRLGCYKISKRFDQDISAVCAAFFLRLDSQGRVAGFRSGFGGMAAIPKRARCLEKAVLGQPWVQSSIDRAVTELAADFTPIDDLRASANYRLVVAGNLLRKFYLETAEVDQPTRLFGQSEHALGTR
jgi:xanthine dehydrogenase small subunit